MLNEENWLLASLAIYFLAAVTAVLLSARRQAGSYVLPLGLLSLALTVQTVAILLRWDRLGHGPYVNLYEILSSNIWSLHLAVLIACLWFRKIRPSLAMILPVLQILVLWLFSLSPVDGEAPVTYATVWLAVHVWLGKVFMGCIVVAVGLSLVILARHFGNSTLFSGMPGNAALEEFIYRLFLIAFLFESLMLVAGAIWAQDAWGRYWAWDPLETWAFATWLGVIGFLHLRITKRPPAAVGAVLVLAVFIIAFSTFFGMPFVSTAPHKGAV